MHGTTFGGGPLACAVACAVIDTIERDGLLDNATKVGGYFIEQLCGLEKKHPAIIDVRGKGLMLAAELNSADLAKKVVAEMLKRHIVINCTSETVLRFLPPYILKKSHVDEAIHALDDILTEEEQTPALTGAAKGAIHGQ
jgi:acetylornithine aminotransferase/acetylornithine/N-succinyldiaminopimelate aminotransferase